MRTVNGGSGSLYLPEGEAVLNDTSKEYEIDSAYNTVRNGRASRIAIQPGEVAWKIAKGDPYTFTCWGIGKREELPENVKVCSLKKLLNHRIIDAYI